MAGQGARRSEILDVAAQLIATSGVRTSLQEIGDACGILPGSLYHHFESKQALVLALVDRYRAELKRVCEVVLEEHAGRPLPQRVTALATAVADCAVRHRAALLLTFYEAPEGADKDVARLAGVTPPQALSAMRELMRPLPGDPVLREGVDPDVFADRLCQSMLHVAIGGYHQMRGAQHVPALKCALLLEGLLGVDQALPGTGSAAMQVAREVVAGWSPRAAEVDADRATVVAAAARREFARRGFAGTTVRDIAAAAGFSTGTVYRTVDSKEDLLRLITADYATGVASGWRRVIGSSATPVEKIDGLLWFHANVVDRFEEEHRMLSVLLRESPLRTATPSAPLGDQVRQLKALVSAGRRDGTLRALPVSLEVYARTLLALSWTPENLVRGLGVDDAHALARATLLRGAVLPMKGAALPDARP